MSIVKRKRALVFTDNGILIVKTPAECTSWPAKFRTAIIRDYAELGHERSASQQTRIASAFGALVVSGVKVKFNQRVRLARSDSLSPTVEVTANEVIDIERGLCMLLRHDNPAMRMLMAYSFIKQIDIAGVPPLKITKVTS